MTQQKMFSCILAKTVSTVWQVGPLTTGEITHCVCTTLSVEERPDEEGQTWSDGFLPPTTALPSLTRKKYNPFGGNITVVRSYLLCQLAIFLTAFLFGSRKLVKLSAQSDNC